MPSTRLTSIVLALAILGLIVPSGAVLTDDRPVDDVWEENGIVVAPADGPNGDYAQIDENGKLAVDISDPGVNKNGKTLIRKVFVIANTGDSDAMFWLSHDGDASITLFEYVSSGHLDQDTIEERSLHGENQSRELAPGEELVVSVYVDTTTRSESAGPVIMETLTLTAQTEDATTTTATTTTTTSAPAGTPTTSTTTTNTTTTTTTRTTVAENETVEIEFEDDENETGTSDPEPGDEPTDETDETVEYQVEDVDPNEIDEEPNDPDRNPTAVITNRSADEPEPPEQKEDDEPNDAPAAASVDTVTNEGESVDLSGTQSIIPHSERVDRERKIADAKNITVQKGYEDRSATLRFRISREKLGDTAPENARVGRLTDRGWQLLETKVVHETPDFVILQARTPGFSTFAVFSSPDVTYEWTLPDGTTYVGENVRAQFDEAGIYNVTLTVTDAAGRSDTADYRILVNDDPEIKIEAPENISEGDRVTLHANVTNRFGNTTVRWRLPNGETAIGPNATYVAPEGDHEVTATVVDEYDARNATTVTLGPQETARVDEVSAFFGGRFPLLTWVTLALLTAVAVLGLLLHRGTPRPKSIGGRPLIARLLSWRRRPRIVEFAVPLWNPEQSRFEVPTLSVTDPHNELERLELLVQGPNDSVLAQKTLDLRGRTQYTATPELIYGIPAAAINPNMEYEATVRAINTRERTATDTQPVTWFHPSPFTGRVTHR